MADARSARSEEETSRRKAEPDKARPSKIAKFNRWFIGATIAAGIAISCSESADDFVIPFPPNNQHETSDGGSGGTEDAGPDLDGGPDLDADVDADTEMDSGPDLDADTDADTELDSGPDLDADTDADTEMDSGPDLDADTDADTELDSGPDLDADTDADTEMDSGPDLDADTDADTELDSGPDLDADVDSGIETCDGIIYDEILIAGDFERYIPAVVGGYHITFVSPTSTGVRLDITCNGSGSDVVIDELFGIEDETIVEVPSDGKRIRITPHSKNTWEANMTVIVEDLPGGVTDGGVSDAGPDSSMDGGISDSGPDSDVDGGVEVCVAAYNDSISMETFDKNISIELGGYNIVYSEPTPGGLVLNITCNGTDTDVVIGENVPLSSEYIIDIPSDAKIMRVTVHSRNTWHATMSISIEDS